MESFRPIAMSIAGLDPSGGAGLLADIKTFEQHRVYGLGIATAQTLQTEDRFFSIRWEKDDDILTAIHTLVTRYEVRAVKIGIVPGLSSLHRIVCALHAAVPQASIVVDPVIRSTTAFAFWQEGMRTENLYEVLRMITLITPNYTEITRLVPDADAWQAAEKLAAYGNVLLKGGHNPDTPGTDYLFTAAGVEAFMPGAGPVFPKHGSGCVLSSAITSGLAHGHSLPEACRQGKQFTEKFLSGNTGLLGYYVS